MYSCGMSSFVNSLHILAILSTDTKFANNLKEIVGNTKAQRIVFLMQRKIRISNIAILKALLLFIGKRFYQDSKHF